MTITVHTPQEYVKANALAGRIVNLNWSEISFPTTVEVPAENERPVRKFWPIGELSDLKVGDLVRGKISHRTFVVTANYGTRVTAVSSQDITNPMEWEVLKP